jgi:hypothetical protein
MEALILSPGERNVFDYLAREEWSQAGECYGKSLDALVSRGIALRVPSNRSYSSSHFDLVLLTGCGQIILQVVECFRN